MDTGNHAGLIYKLPPKRPVEQTPFTQYVSIPKIDSLKRGKSFIIIQETDGGRWNTRREQNWMPTIENTLPNSLRAQYGAASIEREGGLPPATNKHMIASENFHVSKDPRRGPRYAQPERSRKVRSLPNSSGSSTLHDDYRRQPSSAPGRKDEDGKAGEKPMPKFNNLVKGELAQDVENPSPSRKSDAPQPSQATRGAIKKTKPNANKEKFLAMLDNASRDPSKRDTSPSKSNHIKLDGAVSMEKRAHEVKTVYKGANAAGPKGKQPDIFHAKPMKEKTTIARDVEEKLQHEKTTVGNTIILGGQSDRPPVKPKQHTQFQQEKTVIFNGESKTFKPKAKVVGEKREKTIMFKEPPRPYPRTKTNIGTKEDKPIHIQLASEQTPPDPTKEVYTVHDAVNVYVSEFVRIKTKTTLNRKVLQKRKKSAKRRNLYTDPMRNIPPWHRREYVLNKREANMYRHISTVYGNEKLKEQRQNIFYRRVLEMQLENWRNMHEEYQRLTHKKFESKMHQKRALKRLREKFEDDQVKRFRTQYVTSRVLQHEWVDRHEYGLPDDVNDEPEFRSKLKSHSKKPEKVFDFKTYYFKNKNKYSKIFQTQFGPDWNINKKVPKMEGIDVLDMNELEGIGLQDAGTKSRKVAVKDLVSDAEKMLQYETDESSEEDEDEEHPLTQKFRKPEKTNTGLRTVENPTRKARFGVTPGRPYQATAYTKVKPAARGNDSPKKPINSKPAALQTKPIVLPTRTPPRMSSMNDWRAQKKIVNPGASNPGVDHGIRNTQNIFSPAEVSSTRSITPHSHHGRQHSTPQKHVQDETNTKNTTEIDILTSSAGATKDHKSARSTSSHTADDKMNATEQAVRKPQIPQSKTPTGNEETPKAANSFSATEPAGKTTDSTKTSTTNAEKASISPSNSTPIGSSSRQLSSPLNGPLQSTHNASTKSLTAQGETQSVKSQIGSRRDIASLRDSTGPETHTQNVSSTHGLPKPTTPISLTSGKINRGSVKPINNGKQDRDISNDNSKAPHSHPLIKDTKENTPGGASDKPSSRAITSERPQSFNPSSIGVSQPKIGEHKAPTREQTPMASVKALGNQSQQGPGSDQEMNKHIVPVSERVSVSSKPINATANDVTNTKPNYDQSQSSGADTNTQKPGQSTAPVGSTTQSPAGQLGPNKASTGVPTSEAHAAKINENPRKNIHIMDNEPHTTQNKRKEHPRRSPISQPHQTFQKPSRQDKHPDNYTKRQPTPSYNDTRKPVTNIAKESREGTRPSDRNTNPYKSKEEKPKHKDQRTPQKQNGHRDKENKKPRPVKTTPQQKKKLSQKPAVNMDMLDELLPPESKNKKGKQGKDKTSRPGKKAAIEPRGKVSENDDYEPPKTEKRKLITRDAERPDIPDDLLRVTDDEASDDEDIFEKAMRKYGIVLDSDED